MRYSKNIIGEAGDSWGIPVLMGVIGSVSLSNDSDASRSLINESSYLIILGCSFIFCMVWRSLGLCTLSKTPFTSILRVELMRCFLLAWSIFVARNIAASTAVHFGLPRMCRLLRR
jgi:hypothetical protein